MYRLAALLGRRLHARTNPQQVGVQYKARMHLACVQSPAHVLLRLRRRGVSFKLDRVNGRLQDACSHAVWLSCLLLLLLCLLKVSLLHTHLLLLLRGVLRHELLLLLLHRSERRLDQALMELLLLRRQLTRVLLRLSILLRQDRAVWVAHWRHLIR